MADVKLTALPVLSVPTLDDYAYIVDAPAGTPGSAALPLDRIGGLFLPSVCQGRLTTESGVPISTTDRVAQSTLYFTPYQGNRVALYDGTRWVLYAFTQRSLALSGLNVNWPYDVFLYVNAGTLTLELQTWATHGDRLTDLTTQDGVMVKVGATTRRYIGTIHAITATTTEDSLTRRLVWNAQNAVPRPMLRLETTGSWTYNAAAWRGMNNSLANRLDVVSGLAGGVLPAMVSAAVQASAGLDSSIGLGLDDTTVAVPMLGAYTAYSVTSTLIASGYAQADVAVPLGYHSIYAMEFGVGGGVTFYGARTTSTPIGTGIKGVWMC